MVDTVHIKTRLANSRLLPPVVVVVLTAAAILVITLLVERVDSSRRAQLASGTLALTVRDLEGAPFSADAQFNTDADARSPHLAQIVKGEIRSDEAKLAHGLSLASAPGAPAGVVAAGRADLARIKPAVVYVFGLAMTPGGLAKVGPAKIAAAQARLAHGLRDLSAILARLGSADAASAQGARKQAEAGIVVAMVLLLVVFGYFYFRAERLTRENKELLGLSREEATTDVLTGLGNRRALIDDLNGAIARHAPGAHELLVAIFDLDGFKHYNDTFGHVAGDALLRRLGGRLSEATLGSGTSYRMGGDEFCMLAWSDPDSAQALIDRALTALSDSGEGWQVSCSQGAVWMPSEATTTSEALRAADLRMYANKASRAGTGRQIADVLLQVLKEQHKGMMNVNGGRVAELSGAVAMALHQSDVEIQRVRLAATLHDVGKTALPMSLLNKQAPLTAQELEFMHRHTLIGERIVLAAPALAGTAPLIRSSHERPDGLGFPDGLRGMAIPLGSRIIAACESFDAMTSPRPGREAASEEVALEELRRCTGTRFDPAVVGALCEVVSAKRSAPAPPTAGIAC